MKPLVTHLLLTMTNCIAKVQRMLVTMIILDDNNDQQYYNRTIFHEMVATLELDKEGYTVPVC